MPCAQNYAHSFLLLGYEALRDNFIIWQRISSKLLFLQDETCYLNCRCIICHKTLHLRIQYLEQSFIALYDGREQQLCGLVVECPLRIREEVGSKLRGHWLPTGYPNEHRCRLERHIFSLGMNCTGQGARAMQIQSSPMGKPNSNMTC